MAGLFERMGLVRTEYEGMPEIPMQPVSEPMYAPETPVIDATQVSYDDVIASIYQQGDIDDENSIFKIKAYIDILPQDMTKAKKQASIAGILSVNGINVDDLIEDGLKRGRALDAAEVWMARLSRWRAISMPATTPTLDRRCLLNVQRLSPSISSLAVLIRTV